MIFTSSKGSVDDFVVRDYQLGISNKSQLHEILRSITNPALALSYLGNVADQLPFPYHPLIHSLLFSSAQSSALLLIVYIELRSYGFEDSFDPGFFQKMMDHESLANAPANADLNCSSESMHRNLLIHTPNRSNPHPFLGTNNVVEQDRCLFECYYTNVPQPTRTNMFPCA